MATAVRQVGDVMGEATGKSDQLIWVRNKEGKRDLIRSSFLLKYMENGYVESVDGPLIPSKGVPVIVESEQKRLSFGYVITRFLKSLLD